MHAIDCHILTLPRFSARWVQEMRSDLDAEPVNQHWLPGIDGELAEARARGFSAGSAPFVTSADPDDRILPGTYVALLKALEDNPAAPFAWAGERLVDEDLKPWRMREHVWPHGYDPLSHISRGTHVHGVKLYRREFVMPLLDLMRAAGTCCEFLLDLAIVKPWGVQKSVHPYDGSILSPQLAAIGEIPPIPSDQKRADQSKSGPVTAELSAVEELHRFEQFPSPWIPRSNFGQCPPVHVPMVGRLWRQHRDNGFRDFKASDFERMAQVLGFDSMNALCDAVVREHKTTGKGL